MPDRDVYERAKTELAECEKRATQLRSFIATFDQLASGLAQPRAAPAAAKMHDPIIEAAAPNAPRQAATVNPLRPYDYAAATPPEAMDDIVEAVIRDAGKPVPRTPLFEGAKSRGVVIVGKNPLNTFTTRVHRSKRFVSVFGLGYWLAGEPIPPEADSGSGSGGDDGGDSLPFLRNGEASGSSRHIDLS